MNCTKARPSGFVASRISPAISRVPGRGCQTAWPWRTVQPGLLRSTFGSGGTELQPVKKAAVRMMRKFPIRSINPVGTRCRASTVGQASCLAGKRFRARRAGKMPALLCGPRSTKRSGTYDRETPARLKSLDNPNFRAEKSAISILPFQSNFFLNMFRQNCQTLANLTGSVGAM